MDWLNYHHLLYFWVVAREGSISKACQELRLAQPTISGQIKALEESLGEKLFDRVGRGLVLTETGQIVYRYADQIFALGKDLKNAINGRSGRRALIVGIADSLPKLLSHRILEPAKNSSEPVRIVCREGRPDELFGLLALHELDVVLTDAPIGPHVRVKAFSHQLGECGTSFLVASQLSAKSAGFPQSLDGAPMLLPTTDSAMRGQLDRWFIEQNVRPMIVGEFADSALMKIFGESGEGIFPVPTVMEKQLVKGGLVCIGRTEDVREKIYLITTERKIKHPAVNVILERAKGKLDG